MTLSLTLPTVNGSNNTWGTILNTALTDTQNYVNNLPAFPSGGIIMWSGTIANIPTGFVICDGTNGTPNLTDRFIVGSKTDSGATHDIGDTGGANSLTLSSGQLPSHSHGVGNLAAATGGSHSHTGNTSNVGNHTHTGGGAINSPSNAIYGAFNTSTFKGYGVGDSSNTNTGGAGSHSHTITTNSGGEHSHNIAGNTGAQGSGSSIDNRPAYFALAFIMKS